MNSPAGTGHAVRRRWPGAAAMAAAGLSAAVLCGPATSGSGSGAAVVAWKAVGDAIPQPLSSHPGDAERGRQIVLDRRTGLCLLCHALPGHGPQPEARFQGNLAPSLAGSGTRWTRAQLRLRVADNRLLNPASLMPAFHRLPEDTAATRVGSAWQGQPVLNAQQVEDVVAFLETLR